MTQGADYLFATLGAANTSSIRSTGTAEEVAVVTSPPSASPGPVSITSASPVATTVIRRPVASAAERSTRYRQSASSSHRLSSRRHHQASSSTAAVLPPLTTTTAIVSERVAGGVGGEVTSRRRTASPASASISSASDLSLINTRSKRKKHHHRRRHRRHHSVSSSSSSEAPPPVVVRTSKRPAAPPVPSKRSSSTSSSDAYRRYRRRRKHKKAAALAAPVIEEADECGRCEKPRMVDPLDPALNGLSAKKKERIREEIIRRILRLKRNNPNEDIRLPVRGINDPVVCYRRYRRIARHLYAKRSISSYQMIVFVFTLVVQVGMSILFGPVAAEYLKGEYQQIGKYDSIFYEMGCRAYSPYSSPQSPEYRFAWQLITPILLIAITFFISKYTPIPPVAIGLFNNIASTYLKNQEVIEYRTLLHDEDNDEPDEESDDDDSEVGDTTNAAAPQQRGPRIHIPDLESDLPSSENMGIAAVQMAIPNLVNIITSLRAQPEGGSAAAAGVGEGVDGNGMMGTLLGLANAFLGGRGGAAVPKAQPAAPAAPTPVIYAD